ncbi:MAG TPA: pseudaminic acid biosynthesis-associated methylase [Planctomycetaceae bacterium]|jgi:pseudaminic acid biosynthesis-associated methylase|nr:pseudaminic acid biosynthesis-associated methylase [Planctomycetaceae bacterium]
MTDLNFQSETWAGEFGREYTDRNSLSLAEVEALHLRMFGLTKTQISRPFLDHLDRSIRILEIGSNIGSQLKILQAMGFQSLCGLELQQGAIEKAKAGTTNINFMQGNALDVPFKDGFFDLVFTSGVLIHIAPDNLRQALSEIYRCSRRYVFGFEYFAEEMTEVTYHGRQAMLWKTDYCKLYHDQFPELSLVKEQKFKCLDSELVNSMFLLTKS